MSGVVYGVRMRSPQPGMQRPSRDWINRSGRGTEARSRRLRSRTRFGVEALEARFLLAGTGATDPEALSVPLATPVPTVATPLTSTDPVAPIDPGGGSTGQAAPSGPGLA